MFTESSGLWGIFAAADLSRHDAVQLWMSAPFILLLVMIAMMPLAGKRLKRFWERFYPAVSIAAGLIVAAYYVWLVPGGAHDVWHSVKEYVSFIALVGSLFVISGGITIKLNGEATPKTNVIFLLFGALLSNAIGTTGASMVLIRPWMRMNRYRLSAFHIVFFIFIVSNVGGALTPIGDPPLYIGYLRGVDFFWVFEHANLPWAFVVASLLGVFYLMDLRSFRKAGARGLVAEKSAARMMCSVRGAKNIGWLLVVVCAVFLPGQVPAPARELLETYFVREIVMVAAAAASYFRTRPEIHAENNFSFEPIREVAFLFVGIFLTMVPALAYLTTHGEEIGAALTTPAHYFFAAGTLSGVLDNTPTYNSRSGAGGMDDDVEQPRVQPARRRRLARIGFLRRAFLHRERAEFHGQIHRRGRESENADVFRLHFPLQPADSFPGAVPVRHDFPVDAGHGAQR